MAIAQSRYPKVLRPKLLAACTDAKDTVAMPRKRMYALYLLIAALIVIIAIGFYMSVTHTDTHGREGSVPGNATPRNT